jgi:hypothetical protein
MEPLREKEKTKIHKDNQLFHAGYEFVDCMRPFADGGIPFPHWFGWALREAFWKGALWQKERGK